MVIVFYPVQGVSAMQKGNADARGKNTIVIGVEGNFDQAQTGVKAIFPIRNWGENVPSRDAVLSAN